MSCRAGVQVKTLPLPNSYYTSLQLKHNCRLDQQVQFTEWQLATALWWHVNWVSKTNEVHNQFVGVGQFIKSMYSYLAKRSKLISVV